MTNPRDAQAERDGLDHFESALLDQLKGQVAEQSARASHVQRTPLQPWTRRAVVLAGAAAVLVVTITAVATNAQPTPAYAVNPRSNGEIAVTVTRLEGADRLEEELRKHGVAADVTYLDWGKKCAPGRYDAVRNPRDLLLSVSQDEFTVEIPAGSMGPRDTFVLSAAVQPLADGVQFTVAFDITADPDILPCQVVDA